MADPKATATIPSSPESKASVDEVAALKDQLEQLILRLDENTEALQDTAAMCAFYNQFCRIGMRLDMAIGTKAFLAEYQDAIKCIRKELKKVVPKSTLLDKITMPFRFLSWVGIVFSSCLQIILLAPLVYPIQLVLRAVGQKSWSPFTYLGYLCSKCVLASFGIYVHHIEDAGANTHDRTKGAILTYNHVANVDPFATFMGSPGPALSSFLGKKTLYFVPLFGFAALLVGHIPINRRGREKAQSMVNVASNKIIIQQRRILVIAPEGTRSWDGHLSVPFKKGTFHIQRATKAQLLPIVVHGAYECWPRGTFFTRTGEITIRRMRAVPFDADKSHDDVRRELQHLYLNALYPTSVAAVKRMPKHKKLTLKNGLKCLATVITYVLGTIAVLKLLGIFYHATLGISMMSWRFVVLFCVVNLTQIIYIFIKHR